MLFSIVSNSIYAFFLSMDNAALSLSPSIDVRSDACTVVSSETGVKCLLVEWILGL